MAKRIKRCKCGSTEFITEPNQYDVYEIIDGKLEMTHSEDIDDEFKLYCRECSEELENAEDYL
ncbi:MAG: hypothetical protein LBR36_00725 [Bacteroidales bacterium]|jgi:hypothetical protein|nr:hypothetical protein [Bacteroidales bacterium]